MLLAETPTDPGRLASCRALGLGRGYWQRQAIGKVGRFDDQKGGLPGGPGGLTMVCNTMGSYWIYMSD